MKEALLFLAKVVKTFITVSDDKVIFQTVDEALANNKQVYVIAPLIDFSEDGKEPDLHYHATCEVRHRVIPAALHSGLRPSLRLSWM